MKKSMIITLAVALSAFLLASCGTAKNVAFPKMYEEDPVVMLVMPPINNSSAADAKDYFYTTMSVPICESGYYVLPPAATMATLQRESAYDSELFIDGDLKKFGQLFGADVAIFTIIKSWDKSLVGSSVTIEIEYIFKSTKTNEILFQRDAKIKCDTSSNTRLSGFGLVGALVNLTADAIKTATTDYVSVAVMCNNRALSDVPYGKYHPKHGADGAEGAMGVKVNISAAK
ncbi:MAG: DUF799 family lipoprotein [Treponema sp.]|uniref:GNA1162 family protein n=1 Tax=Treponema sp. TaxID=166 RepID=UPI0025F45BB4|nr:GNA1162 family protein [Treponema sp.]MBQ8678481.1 DUF799 family lipoprotein [Treponema sp.]